ncbi:MAG: hypothetical protein ACLP0H_20910 [Terriglobales bacterium]
MGNPVVGDGAGGPAGVTGTGTGGSSGVVGISDSGYGVTGTSSTSGTGVNGNSSSGFGVAGQSQSGEGVHGVSVSNDGVHGINGSGSGTTPHFGCGVRGESDNGYGVYAASKSTDGVHADSASKTGSAVSGINSVGGVGIYGQSTGNAGQFDGNVAVTGNVTVTGKSRWRGTIGYACDGPRCWYPASGFISSAANNGQTPQQAATQYCQQHGQLSFNIPFTKIPVTISLSATLGPANYSATNDISAVFPVIPWPEWLAAGASVDVTVNSPAEPSSNPNVGLGKNLSVGYFTTPNGPQGLSLSVGPSIGPPINISVPTNNACGMLVGGKG